jgi:hypothetical protein
MIIMVRVVRVILIIRYDTNYNVANPFSRLILLGLATNSSTNILLLSAGNKLWHRRQLK